MACGRGVDPQREDHERLLPLVVLIIVRRDHNAHRQSKILHTSIQNIGMKEEMPTDPRQRHRQSRVTEENLRQWLHPQSFWPFSHACRPLCRCTGDWKVPDCSGWMPKSFGPQRHDHWNGRLGAVPQGGPSPTAHHGAAPPAPLSCSTRSCHESTDCRVPPGFIHDELQAHLLAPVASNDLDKSGSAPALLSKSPGSACTYSHRWWHPSLC